jgi:hypothetical protein
MKFLTALLLVSMPVSVASACELCSIYSASSARGESTRGFLLGLSEQFTAYNNTQLNGDDISVRDPDHLDNSITHLAPTYNFSSRFGLSLNVPLIYNRFRRFDVRYSRTEPLRFETEEGSEFGLGDMALIGRRTVFQKSAMTYAVLVNLLAGVKFPTGDASRIKDEVEQSRIFNSLLPEGTPHDPLGHSAAGVHQHTLALGSGSYDGIFGLTVNSRWKRFFFNSQFQYYLRTKGESDFQFGDEIIVSGGPGAYVVLLDDWTLSLQLNGVYESEGRDELLGQKSDLTGMTAWYAGPQLGLTWGEHFAASFGIDIPLRITSNGFQNVPDYRVHGGVNWRF